MRTSFFSYLSTDPAYYAAAVLAIVLSITFHELAHGWVAIKLGDRTPIETGHMTYNPLVHMGPFAIVAMLIAGIAWGQMPVDSSRLRGKWAEAKVAFAGPAVNLMIALVSLVALGLWIRFGGLPGEDEFRVENGQMVLRVFGVFNAILFVFNLLPVPPLDGSRILANANRDYARWAFDPANAGPVLILFVVAWLGFAVFVPYVQLGALRFAYAIGGI